MAASEYRHGFAVVPATPHAGTLPTSHGFVQLDPGSVIVAAVKMAEDGGRRLVLRLSEIDGREAIAAVRTFQAPTAAWLCDLNERRLEAGPAVRLDGTTVTVPVAPHTVATLAVEFGGDTT